MSVHRSGTPSGFAGVCQVDGAQQGPLRSVGLASRGLAVGLEAGHVGGIDRRGNGKYLCDLPGAYSHADFRRCHFVERDLPYTGCRSRRRFGIQNQSFHRRRGGCPVGIGGACAGQGAIDDELHDLAGRERVGYRIFAGHLVEPPEGFIGRGVDHAHDGPVGQPREIDDDVDPFRQRQKQGLVGIGRRNGRR